MGILFHDIRSPMAALKTVADFVEDDNENLNESTMELLKEMQKLSAQGLSLVDNIWAIYELENKDLSTVKSPVNVRDVFDELMQEFEGKSALTNMKFEVYSITTVINIHQYLLTSVIRNLLSNAFKFSPSGTTVKLNASETKDNVLITIKDQGQGFSREDQQNIFKKFQKLSANPLHNEKSSGLGLYLVKLICNKINATIELKSEQNKGAEFTITLSKN